MKLWKRLSCFVFLLLLIFPSMATAKEKPLATAFATDGKTEIPFSYPEGLEVINEGRIGTTVYLDENNYVAVCVPGNNRSGTEALRDNMGDAAPVFSLSDDLHVAFVPNVDNHWMPRMDVINVSIDLPEGNGLVLSAFCEYGSTQVYDLLVTIVGSVTDAAPLAQWLNERTATASSLPALAKEVPETMALSPTLVDADGNIVIIDNGILSVYHYATMELLWQAPYEGEEYSVSRNTAPSILAFVTKAEDRFILHRVDTQAKKLESYPLSAQQSGPFYTVRNGAAELCTGTYSLPEKPQGPIHFVQDGILYQNQQGAVRKYAHDLGNAYTFSFPQPVSDVYHAVSSDTMDYIIHSAGTDDSRMICVSGFAKNNEHRFTTALYSPAQVQAALCEALPLEDQLIIAFPSRMISGSFEPMLWISTQGEIIRRQPIEEKNCSLRLRNDGKTDNLYVFLNTAGNAALSLKVYNPQGEIIHQQATERLYPFIDYFCIQDTWYIWNEGKTGLVPLFH